MDFKPFVLDKKFGNLDSEIMNVCSGAFGRIDEIRDYNQLKVLKAFTDNRVGARHMSGSTGYGYDDAGRDMLDKLFADITRAQDALCRTQFVSGTHAITVALFGILRKGMTMLSVTGTPYDTLRTVLGIRGHKNGLGSLMDFGVSYRQIELVDTGPDYETLSNTARHADLIYIQRSRGYSSRRALRLEEIAKISEIAKSVNRSAVVAVDNCYGEFTRTCEPTEYGADVIMGSLIKNPGGGIAETGGYIAGRADLVEMCANRLTAPGVGREVGSNPSGYRNLFLGLYMAPSVVAEALKSAVYASALFEKLGFETAPGLEEERDDIVTTVKMNSARNLELLCRALQSSSPVDSYAVPEASRMPGYKNKVIMASGAFTAGSSIEISADAPFEAPYYAYIQGGLNLISSRYAFLKAAEALEREGV